MEKDPISKAIKNLAAKTPSRGFDERLLARMRVQRLWKRALGLGVVWSAAGTAAVAALPFWLGIRTPSVEAAKLQAAAVFVEAVRWLSLAGREAAGMCAPCLAIELLAASLIAAAAMALLAPKPVPTHGRVS